VGWSESKLNESCNEYVDTLSDRCTSLWGNLNTSLESKLCDSILVQTWHHIIESSFLSLLEGFSNVLTCSTEGRALMSIDLATFNNNLGRDIVQEYLETNFDDFSKLPPRLILDRGMQYVDMYIKIYYFPQEDAIKWIKENRKKYHLTHLLSLVTLYSQDQKGNRNENVLQLFKEVKRFP